VAALVTELRALVTDNPVELVDDDEPRPDDDALSAAEPDEVNAELLKAELANVDELRALDVPTAELRLPVALEAPLAVADTELAAELLAEPPAELAAELTDAAVSDEVEEEPPAGEPLPQAARAKTNAAPAVARRWIVVPRRATLDLKSVSGILVIEQDTPFLADQTARPTHTASLPADGVPKL